MTVFSSGSALDGGPSMYLHSAMGHPKADFREMASFRPFGADGPVSVATNSTTEGANLLVAASTDGSARVLRFELVRPDDVATALDVLPLGEAMATEGSVVIGGD